MIPIPYSTVPNPRPCQHPNVPCIVCSQPVKPGSGWMIHVHKGGSHAVTEAEAAALNAAGGEGGDMCFLPVGAGCMRRHPELRPYAIRNIPTGAQT